MLAASARPPVTTPNAMRMTRVRALTDGDHSCRHLRERGVDDRAVLRVRDRRGGERGAQRVREMRVVGVAGARGVLARERVTQRGGEPLLVG